MTKSVTHAATDTAKRPNLLLISFDDCIAFWKYRHVFGAALQTPNLDRICAQSTAFHAAYAQVPLCGPSRASFMSGKSPHQIGVFSNKISVFDRIPAEDMWSVRLRERGWFCSSGGKVHHGYRPLRPAVHTRLYDDQRKRFRIDIRLPKAWNQTALGGHGGGKSTVDDADDHKYHDANSALSFSNFIDNYDGDAPFYREVGFFGPHTPFITPLKFKKLYKYGQFAQPESWRSGWDHNPYADEHMIENKDTSKRTYWQKSVRNYFAALTHADHYLGKVWDKLKSSRHADNTRVVILSDHGFHLGEKNRFRKSSLWEQVAGVPLILHDPANPVGRVVDDPVALVDVGPTVMDWFGLPPIPDSPGQSLLPCMTGAHPAERPIPIFFAGSTGIRLGDYRFIRYADGSTELFDIKADWWGMKNLGPDHPAHAMMAKALQDCLPDWHYSDSKAFGSAASEDDDDTDDEDAGDD